ncbi:hypothetical protein [Desulfoscipio gibsoniae]|nr:hypothetical protein [Desulfoscipio gibsoniae]
MTGLLGTKPVASGSTTGKLKDGGHAVKAAVKIVKFIVCAL